MNTASACRLSAAHESLLGTAPQRNGWLLIESSGSWGARAVDEGVDPLTLSWARKNNFGCLLVRQHGRHVPAQIPAGSRSMWLSLSNGELLRAPWGTPVDDSSFTAAVPSDPMLVICTNGARDQCCAVEGISLRKQLVAHCAPQWHPRIWEGTHIGGHRFAPTALYLPGNYVLGRLDLDAALALVTQGLIPRSHLRGQSHFSPCHQVLYGEIADYLDIQWEDPDAACPDVTHTHWGEVDGVRRGFTIGINALNERQESCTSEPTPGITRRFVEE